MLRLRLRPSALIWNKSLTVECLLVFPREGMNWSRFGKNNLYGSGQQEVATKGTKVLGFPWLEHILLLRQVNRQIFIHLPISHWVSEQQYHELGHFGSLGPRPKIVPRTLSALVARQMGLESCNLGRLQREVYFTLDKGPFFPGVNIFCQIW